MLTRIDGDGRGGAALSMRAVTGKPIKLMGVGENSMASRGLPSDRIAGRILGMGDIVSLVEKATERPPKQDEAELPSKMQKKGPVRPDDMATQLKQVQKMGGLAGIMGMLPGIGKMQKPDADGKVDETMVRSVRWPSSPR